MSTSVTWDPEQYLRFAAPRVRPAIELLARIDHDQPHRVYDLGCGTGEITRLLAARWPQAAVTGIDLSSDMLAVAERESDTITWEHGDIATWTPEGPVDVIYSNAALHWLNEHDRLIPRLAASLAPGGVLAIQMPLSWHEPSHRLMREVLATGGSGGAPLGSIELRARTGTQPVAHPGSYYRLLAPLAATVDIWETRYHQVLTGTDPVFEWVSGTALRPILEALDDAEREQFVTRYRKALRAAYPAQPNGETLFAFPRLFIVATAPGS